MAHIEKSLKKYIHHIVKLLLLSSSNHFQTPCKETLYLLAFTFHSFPHVPVSASGTLLCFLSLGFIYSGNFIQMDSYIMQISFTQRIFKLHLPCSLYHYFTPFYGLRILCCLGRTPFVYLFMIHSWADGQSGYFHLLVIVNNAAINHVCASFCVDTGFHSFRCISRSGIASAKSLQSCLTLCHTMDCSLPGCSVHGILQARILEWVAIPSSRESSQPRDQTLTSSALVSGFLTSGTTWEAQDCWFL